MKRVWLCESPECAKAANQGKKEIVAHMYDVPQQKKTERE
jgi:hypothetical protein